MPVDTSIYANLLRPPKSYNDFEQEDMQRQQNALALQSGRQQAELGQMRLSQGRQEMEQAAATRNALQGFGADQGANYRSLLQAGNLEAAQKYQTHNTSQQKAQREAEKEKLLAAKTQVELIGQVAGAAQDPASYARGLQLLQQAGVDISGIPPQFDPAYVAQARQQALTAMQQIDQQWKAKQFDLDTEKFGYQQRNDTANRGVTVRGQDLSASTAKRGQDLVNARGIEANRIKQSEVNMGGKPPPGYRWDGTGKLVPIPGGPGEIAANKATHEAAERERGVKASVSSIEDQIRVLDKALDHPGRATATGVSGTVDPRNYLPGTDAKNFQVVLDQIGGTAFLQAFESLKGGGQITEVEGRKATEAIARLNRAQSDGEFENALTDLREVMNKGYERHTGKRIERPGKAAPAALGFDADKERRYQEWKAKQGQK